MNLSHLSMLLCMMLVSIFVSCLGITDQASLVNKNENLHQFNKIISFKNLYHFVPL